MIKQYLKLTVGIALTAMAHLAHAQSSVTLYGVVDAGVAYVSNVGGGRLWEAAGSNIQASRWGLRGVEDLGSGLRTIFVLENGFNPLNGKLGQGNDLFGRQAYVGLSSDRAGTVSLGRQYDSAVDYLGLFEAAAQWSTFYDAHPGDLDNINNANRVNNAVKYTSPTYAGFSFDALYGFGGQAGDFSHNQIFSVGGGYAQGPLRVGIAYFNVRDPNFSFFGNNASSSPTASNMTGSRVYSGYASASTQQVIAAGGAYQLGKSTFGLLYSNTAFLNLDANGKSLNPAGYTGSEHFHNVEANYKYQITPALLAGFAYDYTKGYGVNDVTYHQLAIGIDYFLSKRTDVYATGVYQHASGTDSSGKSAVANLNGLSPSLSDAQSIVVLGMRHKF